MEGSDGPVDTNEGDVFESDETFRSVFDAFSDSSLKNSGPEFKLNRRVSCKRPPSISSDGPYITDTETLNEINLLILQFPITPETLPQQSPPSEAQPLFQFSNAVKSGLGAILKWGTK